MFITSNAFLFVMTSLEIYFWQFVNISRNIANYIHYTANFAIDFQKTLNVISFVKLMIYTIINHLPIPEFEPL